RMRPRLSPGPRLSTRTQGDVSRRRVPDAPLALCPRQAGRGHYLAAPVHRLSRGAHGPAAFRPALPLDAPRGGPGCPVGHPWRTELGAVRGALSPLADGALSPHLRVRPPESRDRAHPMWIAAAGLFPR